MRSLLVAVTALLAVVLAGPAAAASERTVVLRHGPVAVGGFMTEKPKVIVPAPKVTGHITRMEARLVDARGRPVLIDRVMLHHVVFLNRGRFRGDRRTHCGARFGEPFYGTGEERQVLDLPPGYGYRIRRGDVWKMQAMLMSHQPRGLRVYVEYRMRVVTGRRLTPVTPYWVRVTNCRNEPSYSVGGGGAPGSIHTRTNTWTVPAAGRIVAGGAHLHGGAYNLELRDPGCQDRLLFDSPPSYAPPDDLVYTVRPTLHEPGPFNTGWFESAQGIPVRRGQRLSVRALYDAERPHPGVMGVMHVYVAPPRGAPAGCAPLPADARVRRIGGTARTTPPAVHVPLSTLGPDGVPVVLPEPLGALRTVPDDVREVSLGVDRGLFLQPRLSVAAGTRLTWRFTDPVPHKVSLANGPRSVGSATLSGGRTFTRPFSVPGVYQLFCYLHPMTMHQQVTVRDGPAATGADPAAEAAPPGDPTYY